MVWWVLQDVAGIAGIIHRNKKKVFFLFLPSHPHKCGSNALFIGVSVVRVGAFYRHTTLTPSFPCRNAHSRRFSVVVNNPTGVVSSSEIEHRIALTGTV